jgi:hypothetical protein
MEPGEERITIETTFITVNNISEFNELKDLSIREWINTVKWVKYKSKMVKFKNPSRT